MFRLVSINDKAQTRIKKPYNFTFHGYYFYFGGICSARVKSITVNEDLSMRVETVNRVYLFKKVNL